MDFVTTFLDSLQRFWQQFLMLVPMLGGTLLLLVAGLVIAQLVRRIALRVLKLIRINAIAELTGFENMLLKGGVPFTTASLIAGACYWFVLLSFLVAALNNFNPQLAEDLLLRLTVHLPGVFVGIVALSVGLFFSRVLRGMLTAYLNNIGVAGADLIGTIGQYVVLAFVTFVALEQLGVGGVMLTTTYQFVFGALCLAFGLAFGLGGKDAAANVLNRILNNDR